MPLALVRQHGLPVSPASPASQPSSMPELAKVPPTQNPSSAGDFLYIFQNADLKKVLSGPNSVTVLFADTEPRLKSPVKSTVRSICVEYFEVSPTTGINGSKGVIRERFQAIMRSTVNAPTAPRPTRRSTSRQHRADAINFGSHSRRRSCSAASWWVRIEDRRRCGGRDERPAEFALSALSPPRVVRR
jgi:hypothetical protein